MNSPKISDLIGKISSKLQDADLSILSKIEYDLLMQQMRELYDELDAFRKAEKTVKDTVIKRVSEREMPVEFLNIKTIHANQKLLLNETPLHEQPAIPVNEHMGEEQKSARVDVSYSKPRIISNQPEVPTAQPEKPAKKAVTSSLNESITSIGSLNEQLKTAIGKEVHKKFAHKPLKDLIDLNKKFALTTELFKGSAEAFALAVNHIDSVEDYEAAQQFVKQKMQQYAWNESSQTTRLFLKLVRQRFGIE